MARRNKNLRHSTVTAKPEQPPSALDVGALSVLGIICFATFLAYFPAMEGGFIWDDNGHITKPELRSVGGLFRIWFDLGATQQYYPLLHSAFWLEYKL